MIRSPFWCFQIVQDHCQKLRSLGSIAGRIAICRRLAAKEGFQALEDYHATVGSFNDALRAHLEEAGAFKALATGLDTLMKRMTGETP
jgi:hypothetical protein